MKNYVHKEYFNNFLILSLDKESCSHQPNLILKSQMSMGMERWFNSTNAKDIGTLYLIFALFSGLLGTAFSVLIRLELSGPGVQYISNNQLYNSVITAHAILMIFFMVDNWRLFNFNFQASTFRIFFSPQGSKKITEVALNNSQNNTITITNSNNNNRAASPRPNKNNDEDKIPLYTKVYIENPFNNRNLILKVSKNQKGVYIWESNDHAYVGHSINLYNRISSYFMPSILQTKARRVLRYFNKHGFQDTNLTIYIMDENSSLDEVVSLEQHFIDTLKPSLNVDLVASRRYKKKYIFFYSSGATGYHEPMGQEIRDRLRKQRGTPVYIYNVEDFTLLYIFESKQHMYDSISIHHKTLNNCLDAGTVYLDTLFLSLDLIEESENTNLLTLEGIKELVNEKRALYTVKHPASISILAEFKDDSSKNLEFSSLTSLANHLKGDRVTIRQYLKGVKSGYYRGKWKFTYKD